MTLLAHGSVIQGDAIEGMRLLLKERSRSFHCVYSDPDYNQGVRYDGHSTRRPFKDYIEWCKEWSRLAHGLLRDDGNFFIMNYPRNNAYLWVDCLDELFHEVHEYVWCYNTNIGHSNTKFTTAHRTILHCRKSENSEWFKDQVAEPYKNPTDKRIMQNIANGSKGRMPYSWMYDDLVKNVSKEKTEHACQIPEGISRKLFAACMKPGNEVLILFGGSGSEVLSAIRLGLRYTVFEIEPEYHAIIVKRAREAEKELVTTTRLPEYSQPLART